MYENIVTNMKNRRNYSLVIFLGIALLLLFISLGLNINKYFKKQTKNKTTTEKNKAPSTIPQGQFKQAQISVNGKSYTIYVPNNLPAQYLPGTQINLIIGNNRSLLVPFPIIQTCPEAPKEEPVIQTPTTPTIEPQTKLIPEKKISRRRIIITEDSVSQTSSIAAYSNSSSSSFSSTNNSNNTTQSSTSSSSSFSTSN